jgi:arylsulfatase A-like enzyme
LLNPTAQLRPFTLLTLLAIAGGTSGCRAPAPPEVPETLERVELVEFASALRVARETTAVDIGEPAAWPHLREGWGAPEKSGTTSFAWGMGAVSRLSFELVDVRDLDLRLRGWSFPFASGESQRVELRINGRAVGEQAIGADATTLRFAVPATLLRAGENILELRYARRNEGPKEAPLAVAWDGVRFAGPGENGEGSPAAPPVIDAAGGTVTLPAGSAVEGTLELAPGTWLAWDAVAAEGSARLELAVEGEATPVAGRRVRPGGDGRRELSGRRSVASGASGAGGSPPSALVRFALRAPGADGEIRVSGLRLEQPRPRAAAPGSGGAGEPGAAVATTESTAAVAARPNLIVYLIDTLRADHLGCYGYPRPTSPRIDRFASESILFAQGRAQSSWTKPAVATILTGLFPTAHGAQLRSQRIHENVDTLAERLQAAGYETALFTTNANIVARFGFAQGWDTFRYLAHRKGRKHQHFDAEQMNREVFAWLAERARRADAKPFLLVVHTLDPHDPYRPREEFRRRLAPEVDVESACCAGSDALAALVGAAAESRAADARALYDAEIAQNDAAFGDLLDELERRDLAPSTAVLLTSDHGEEFLDHGGWKHGFTLYEEMLRIPFILRLPEGQRSGAEGRSLVTPVDQIDIVPTFLALAGAPAAPDLPGRDVRRLLVAERPDRADRPVAGGAQDGQTSFAWLARPGAESTSTVAGGWKSIVFGGDRATAGWAAKSEAASAAQRTLPDRELFRLTSDPDERTNLLDPGLPRPLRALWLEGRLAAALARHGGSAPASESEIDVEIDAELERSLRALGYF